MPRLPDARQVRGAAALVAVSVALGLLAARFDTFPGDCWLAERVRSLGAGFAPVAHVFNERDRELAAASALAVIALAAWRGRRDVIWLVALFVPARGLLQLARAEVGRPRPSGVPVLDAANGPSFPSGHMLTAVLFLGVWLYVSDELLPPRPALVARALAVGGIVLMALSRVWAGAHWPSDTVGGVVWGVSARR